MRKKKTTKGQAYMALEQRRNAMYAMLSKLNSSRIVPSDSIEVTDYSHEHDGDYGYCEQHDTPWNDCCHDHEFEPDDEREDFDY